MLGIYSLDLKKLGCRLPFTVSIPYIALAAQAESSSSASRPGNEGAIVPLAAAAALAGGSYERPTELRKQVFKHGSVAEVALSGRRKRYLPFVVWQYMLVVE